MKFEAEYFNGETSLSTAVQVDIDANFIRVTNEQRLLLKQAHVSELNISPRVANTRRTVRFADGAALETSDNNAVDKLAAHSYRHPQTASLSRFEHWVHRQESSHKAAIMSVIGLLVLGTVGFIWGVPLAARRIAMSVPERMANDLGHGTLAALDEMMFHPSKLGAERHKQLRSEFSKMAEAYPQLPLRLEFRSAMPNAFALPNGTVVVTDELVELAEHDEEVMAVLAHEIGHVHERHALRMAVENSIVALFAMAYLGDASQATVIASSLPAIYANAHFSRAHETEADTFALQFLTQTRVPRHYFADILRRLHAKLGGDDPGVLSYFASHPGLEERAARFVDSASP